MSYFHMLSGRHVVEAFENKNSGQLQLDPIEDAPEGEGLFFDLDSISSILVWINENKEVVVASANLLTACIEYLKSGKSKGPSVTVVLQPSDDKPSEKIEITEETKREEVEERIRKVLGKPSA